MNDPNGLVRIGSEWRLFFQYADDAPAYRRVSWGTATSSDLVSWEFSGIAIPARPDASIYSGCIMPPEADWGDSGAGIRALYTAHRILPGGDARQTLECVVSKDGGQTFDADSRLSVLDEGLANFRDPFVVPLGKDGYALLVAQPVDWNAAPGGTGSRIAVYRSAELKGWVAGGEIGPWHGSQVLWEVPWIVELVRDDGIRRALLVISIVDRSGGGVVCGTRYWVGTFDHATFIPEEGHGGLPLDSGPDYYAPIPATPAGDSSVITVAWVGNWAYARQLPAAPWAGGLLSLPRRLELIATPGGSRVRQCVATGMTPLCEPHCAGDRVVVGSRRLAVAEVLPLPCELDVFLELDTANALCIHLFGGALSLALDCDGASLTLERQRTSDSPPGFAHRSRVPREATSPQVRLRAYVDTCAVEIYADDGAITFCALVFPRNPAGELLASASGGTGWVQVTVTPLASVAGASP